MYKYILLRISLNMSYIITTLFECELEIGHRVVIIY